MYFKSCVLITLPPQLTLLLNNELIGSFIVLDFFTEIKLNTLKLRSSLGSNIRRKELFPWLTMETTYMVLK